jgi:branched-chain amino acid transport system permease protein
MISSLLDKIRAAINLTSRTQGRSVVAVLFAILVLVPLFAKLGAESYLLSLATRAVIFSIAALSLDFIMGYGALVSFGHAAFLGLGSYAVGIMAAHGIDDVMLQVIVALAAATAFAAATSAISLRTSGVYYIMITLAFGQMLFFLGVSLSAYGGDDGMSLSGRSRAFGLQALSSDITFYYVCLAALAGFYTLLRRVVASRFGRVLGGIRENPTRMRAIGFEPFQFQLVACLIAGAICAVAGVLLANHAGFVSPAYMTWQRSGDLMVMVLMGGIGTLHGAILGALAFLLLEEWLSGFTEHWKLIFGPLLVIVALYGRGGLVALLTHLCDEWSRRRHHG